jgi:hypothetical protein
MKSLLVGTGYYLCKVYNYYDSRACSYKQYGIFPRIEGMVLILVLGTEWFGYGLA